jgi:hypothetical protein
VEQVDVLTERLGCLGVMVIKLLLDSLDSGHTVVDSYVVVYQELADFVLDQVLFDEMRKGLDLGSKVDLEVVDCRKTFLQRPLRLFCSRMGEIDQLVFKRVCIGQIGVRSLL